MSTNASMAPVFAVGTKVRVVKDLAETGYFHFHAKGAEGVVVARKYPGLNPRVAVGSLGQYVPADHLEVIE